jgi:hypothetical protein
VCTHLLSPIRVFFQRHIISYWKTLKNKKIWVGGCWGCQ